VHLSELDSTSKLIIIAGFLGRHDHVIGNIICHHDANVASLRRQNNEGQLTVSGGLLCAVTSRYHWLLAGKFSSERIRGSEEMMEKKPLINSLVILCSVELWKLAEALAKERNCAILDEE
jgi:hypothetical protein